MKFSFLAILILLATTLCACDSAYQAPVNELAPVASQTQDYDQALAEIMQVHGVYTLAAGLIENGELVWSGYYGEQSPGVPASARSMFNTASISKVVTAETVLRLIKKGEFGLDDSMASSWVDPDLVDDERHQQLTPRIVLTHRTGFLNWRYMEEDEVLRFHANPGDEFGYSGEGMEYLRRFVEQKTNRKFEEWVQQLVFDPMGMGDSTVVARDKFASQLVSPYDQDGKVLQPNIHPPGSANAADDLFITIEDYAKFLTSNLNISQTEGDIDFLKQQLQSDISEHDNFRCVEKDERNCPETFGFGLGWFVFEYEDYKLVWHGGNDAHEHAVGYINPESGDGAIVFANGATGIMAMLDVLDLIDTKAELSDYYRLLLGL